jgi:hypothetical protein
VANTTEKNVQTIDEEDIDFGEYTAGEQWPVVPEETYFARAIAWNTIDKSDYKQRQQLDAMLKKNPEATLQDVDSKMWEIRFAISRGEYEGFELPYRFNRTDNWHENATATKVVAILAELDKYDRAALKAKFGTVKGLIAAEPECRIVVVLVKSERDEKYRNYVNQVKALPPEVPDTLFAKKPVTTGTPARSQAPGAKQALPHDDEDEAPDFDSPA